MFDFILFFDVWVRRELHFIFPSVLKAASVHLALNLRLRSSGCLTFIGAIMFARTSALVFSPQW